MTNFERLISEAGLEKTLPSSWYTTSSVFDLEREHIFMREWLCVGREQQIANAGDHKVIDVLGESVLLLRNEQNQLRAFYNVCRHRGASLCVVTEQNSERQQGSGQQQDCDEQSGSDQRHNDLSLKGGVVNGRRIVCPYHAWTYDLNGQLLRAPHMHKDMGFDPAKVQLYKVALEVWGGFIFVNLSPQTAPVFADFIAASAENFKRYPLAELAVAHTINYQVNANWKVLCENYNECYHCGPVHPELCSIVPSFKHAGGAELDWQAGVPHKEGANTFTFSGTSARRAFPGLDQNEKNNHKGDLIYPNLFLSFARDHVVAFILHPQGPANTRIECHFLFETYEMEKADFDPSDSVDFWHLTNRQDWGICERVQQGMNARVHQCGVFSPMEDWNLDIRRYVVDRIGQYVAD